MLHLFVLLAATESAHARRPRPEPEVIEAPAPAPSSQPAPTEGNAPYAPELPAAPKGFSWLLVPEARASFLRPDGWFVKQMGDASTRAVFVTKEEIGEDGKRFTTGMTINIIADVPGKKKVPPSAFAVALREGARRQRGIHDEAEAANGKLAMSAYSFVDAAPPPVTVRNVLVANDSTGTLYWMILEGPTEAWPALIEQVGPMLQWFVLDDEV